MKQKNKVSNKNWLLILILTIFELIYIHYVLMQNLEIFFESNFTYFLKLDIVCVCFNLIYVLYIVDFYKNKHKNKNIMKIYKNDINYQFKNVYLFFQIVKTIAFCFVEKRLMLQFIILEVILFVVFRVFVYFNRPKDNKEYKIKKLRRGLRKGKLDIGVILFEENFKGSDSIFVSTLDAYHTVDTKLSDEYIYVDYINDLPKILKNYPLNKQNYIKNKILDNTVIFLKRAELYNENSISEFRKYCIDENLNLKNNYTVIAFDNISNIVVPENLEYLASLKVCESSKYIEFTQNLLSKDKKFDFEKRLQLRDKIVMAVKKYFLKEENIFKTQNEKSSYIKRNLYIKCKEMYNNRLIGIDKTMPKDSDLFEMYKNAFLQNSIHGSYMILLNYINMLHQVVVYYIYAKNNKSFRKDSVNTDIMKDNYFDYKKNLKDNLNKDDIMYNNIMNNREYTMSKEFKDLVFYYLSDLVTRKIEGDTITYSGALFLTKVIRDKIIAHGTISSEDAYLFWAVCYYLCELFNQMFMVNKLESKVENNKVFFRDNNKEKYTFMGNYIKQGEDGTKLISQYLKDEVVDIDYLSGKFVRPLIKKHKDNE